MQSPEMGDRGVKGDILLRPIRGLICFGASHPQFHCGLLSCATSSLTALDFENTPWNTGQTSLMTDPTELKTQIKRLLVEDLMLQITPEEIGDGQPLFGPGGIGLDSVDALQLVVALEKHYGLKISDPEAARGTLQNVNSIASAVTAKSSQ